MARLIVARWVDDRNTERPHSYRPRLLNRVRDRARTGALSRGKAERSPIAVWMEGGVTSV